MITKQQARKIVKAIISDLSDRSGLGNEWEMCDSDIQKEIIESWIEILLENVNV